MYEVTIDTWADGNPYRRDTMIMDWPTLIRESSKNFDGLNGTVVVSHRRVLRCTYCGHWEVESFNCRNCGQPI